MHSLLRRAWMQIDAPPHSLQRERMRLCAQIADPAQHARLYHRQPDFDPSRYSRGLCTTDCANRCTERVLTRRNAHRHTPCMSPSAACACRLPSLPMRKHTWSNGQTATLSGPPRIAVQGITVGPRSIASDGCYCATGMALLRGSTLCAITSALLALRLAPPVLADRCLSPSPALGHATEG